MGHNADLTGVRKRGRKLSDCSALLRMLPAGKEGVFEPQLPAGVSPPHGIVLNYHFTLVYFSPESFSPTHIID